MALEGQITPLVLIPRFTSYINPSSTRDFPSVALDASAYSGGEVVLWCGPLIGSSASVDVEIQDSEDGVIWTALDSGGGSSSSETLTLTLKRRWLRIVVTLAGTNAAITCWCSGYLKRRVA